MRLNPEVWLEHFKFIMTTISLKYPEYPNDVTKKKYYEFIQNIPLFIPMKPLGDDFIKMIDDFPVTPYLDSRLSFMKWVNFIHNKISRKMGIPDESLFDSLEKYYSCYKPKYLVSEERKQQNMKYIKFSIFILLLGCGIYFYKN